MDDEQPTEGPTSTDDRAATYWGSLVSGWLLPGPRTEWTRRVVNARISSQDRIRPYATRGALLTALGIDLAALGVSVTTIAWLTVGMLQTILEMIFESPTRAQSERGSTDRVSESWLGRWHNHIWYLNHEKSITNVTGILGTVAAILNLLVVVYGTGSGSAPGWARTLALALAMCYLASGALGPLADTAMYSPLTVIPPWLAVTLRWLWVPVLVLIGGLLIAAHDGPRSWGQALPYALMTVAGVGYYPMLRCRELERAMAAADEVRDEMTYARYKLLATDLHNLLQPVKDTLGRAASAMTAPEDRAELDRFLRDMRHTYESARNRTLDLNQGLGLPLADHLRSIASAELVRIDVDLRLPADTAAQESQRVKVWLMVLVQNSVQAYRTWEGDDEPSMSVTARASGADILLEVHDRLPLIPAAVWDDPGRTLSRVRADVEALSGSMVQSEHTDGKTITIQWRQINLDRLRIRDTGKDNK